jgi:hypothetical protein
MVELAQYVRSLTRFQGETMARTLPLFVALALMTIPYSAQAQPAQGDAEFSFAGTINSTVGNDFGGFTVGFLQFGVGYFVTDRQEVVVQPLISITSFSSSTPIFNSRGQLIGEESERTTETDMGIAARYLFHFGGSSSRLKPYVGGDFIVSSLKNAGDTGYVAGSGGVKNYLNEKAALDFSGSIGFNLSDAGAGQLLQFKVGLTYLF